MHNFTIQSFLRKKDRKKEGGEGGRRERELAYGNGRKLFYSVSYLVRKTPNNISYIT